MTDTPADPDPKLAPIQYKVIDQQMAPNDPDAIAAMLNTQGQDGWRLVGVYPDPQRERTRWIFANA